jgi:hypothetical protein
VGMLSELGCCFYCLSLVCKAIAPVLSINHLSLPCDQLSSC